MLRRVVISFVITFAIAAPLPAQDPPVTRMPIVRAVDLDVGEAAKRVPSPP
ncbi:MAG: hypothetical protein L0Y71_21600 [Gemmataceae bacterium]|nr:hypothetical protein [Gemmataceae bacterium]